MLFRSDARKIIIFTEHRDTLDYLHAKITAQFGRADSVITIHGGTRREDRQLARERFTHNPDTVVLLATDAAGEGFCSEKAPPGIGGKTSCTFNPAVSFHSITSLPAKTGPSLQAFKYPPPAAGTAQPAHAPAPHAINSSSENHEGIPALSAISFTAFIIACGPQETIASGVFMYPPALLLF